MNKQENVVSMFQPKGKVKTIKGSILAPENAGLRFVLSINNLAGKADGSWYKVFDKKWPKVREQTKGWYNTRTGAYKLGAVNTTAVQSDTWVIHMLCQDDKMSTNMKGLEECLKKVCGMAKYERATVHVSNLIIEAVPEITELLGTQLIDKGVSVYFYEEPKQ
jgi:hypothetical protein